MISIPNLKLELELWKRSFLVVGIDEVGRGSFAGPLVAGGVILNPELNKASIEKLLSLGINDSKKLSSKHRELINKSVQEFTFFLNLQYVDVDIIDKIGIGKSTTLAFERIASECLKKFKNKKIFFLTDAFKINNVSKRNQLNIIRGDQTSISIATASIISKVNRDNFMQNLDKKYPFYSFSQNKGYGTQKHRDAIKKYGKTPQHRQEFVKKYLF